MSLIVHDEEFLQYLYSIKAKFPLMVETMRKVARLIELTTVPYVPLDTGALEQSYEYEVMESSPFILLMVGYDAVDEESGFHYAQYQHDNFLNHPKRGVPYYLTVGIHDSKFEVMELIKSDYLSLFTGGVGSMSFGDNAHASFIKWTNM